MIEYISNETIAAISTPVGVGGIAVIRICGERCVEICQKIFHSKSGLKLCELKPYQAIYGTIKEGEDIIDDVILTRFCAPHSFTGQETIEISCHGSIYIQNTILQLLIKNGCRYATAGEFTQRAFMNGKMDLAQAEAIVELISAQNRAAHDVAIKQLRGGISTKLEALRRSLLQLLSLLELELDFGDHEELEFANRGELIAIACEIEGQLDVLLNSFEKGNAIKNGIPVAIIGATNAGKSTLLNQLVGEQRAIVSDIAGTTRDTIEEKINLGTHTLRIIDTAGIRTTEDVIEKIGIERSLKAIERASIVLWLVDNQEDITPEIYDKLNDKRVLLLINKIDILDDEKVAKIISRAEELGLENISISAKNGEGIGVLINKLVDIMKQYDNDNNVVITSARHFEALTQAKEDISRILIGLRDGLESDLVAMDIRQCNYHLAQITGGEITSNEVLHSIFKQFCIGK